MGTKVRLSRSGNQDRVQRVLDRLDSFQNAITGLGVAGKDKRLGAVVAAAVRLGVGDLDELYRGNALAAKIVDILPNDMTREGWEYKQGDDKEQAQAVTKAAGKLGVLEAMNKGLKWARLYGGAGIVIGADDGQAFDRPLNLNALRAIRFLTVLDRHQLQKGSLYDDIEDPKYGETKTYRLQPLHGGANAGKEIHESRVIRFDGVDLPDRPRLQNDGWGDSVLNRVYNALLGYHTAHDSAGAILVDFAQAVYTMKDLASLLTQGEDGAALVLERLRQIEYSRSVVNAVALDEDEKWERRSTGVSGLKDLVGCAEDRLVAESSMPHTLILGESPGASLGEGGDSQNRDWYDFVASQQEDVFKKPLLYLYELLLRAKEGPTRGRVPASWSLEFRPLWQLDAKEDAEIRKLQADADASYLDRGVLSAEEVAMSRFGGEGYSMDTVLDLEARAMVEDLDDEPEDHDREREGSSEEPGEEDTP